MNTKKNLLAGVLLIALLLQLASCKKDSSGPAAKAMVQPHVTTLSSFSGPLVVSLYAGTGVPVPGDGPRLSASFGDPWGIAASSSGALYITEPNWHRIRKISTSGIVSTLAFSGTLLSPLAITRGNDGILYFIERGTGSPATIHVRKINANDQIQPPLEICKKVNGTVVPYVFSDPFDLAVAADGTMYICDFNTHTIIKRGTNGIATVFAGGTQGYKDGKGTNAQFNSPISIAIDSLNNLYVSDWLNFRIRKITPDGTVSTLAGSSTSGFQDGTGSSAQLSAPADLVVADNNTLLFIDGDSGSAIRRLDLTTGQVTTIAGNELAGYINGPALSARFNSLTQMTINNGNIYTTERDIHRIRQTGL